MAKGEKRMKEPEAHGTILIVGACTSYDCGQNSVG